MSSLLTYELTNYNYDSNYNNNNNNNILNNNILNNNILNNNILNNNILNNNIDCKLDKHFFNPEKNSPPNEWNDRLLRRINSYKLINEEM